MAVKGPHREQTHTHTHTPTPTPTRENHTGARGASHCREHGAEGIGRTMSLKLLRRNPVLPVHTPIQQTTKSQHRKHIVSAHTRLHCMLQAMRSALCNR